MILLISPKNKYATKRLIAEAGRAGEHIVAMDVKELAAQDFVIDITPFDVLFVRFPWPYFTEIIALAKKFKEAGKKVVDASMAIGDADHNKWEMYQTLAENAIPIPKTNLLTSHNSQLVTPCIVKWMFGQKGEQVFLVHNQKQLDGILKKFSREELLVQEYVAAEFEYKVITVGYKSLPVILKFPIHPKTKRPNLAAGQVISQESAGSLHNQVINLAQTAARATQRELAKIDILQKDSQLYVLEVNRWPGFQNFEKLSGYNVAGEFVKYLIQM